MSDRKVCDSCGATIAENGVVTEVNRMTRSGWWLWLKVVMVKESRDFCCEGCMIGYYSLKARQ